MKILVTSPNGTIGRHIVPELLSPEFSVRVITQNPESLPADVREQVEVICGPVDDPATLLPALDDVESVFWSVPSAPGERKGIDGRNERFARALGRAVRQAGALRLVAISPSGLGRTRNAAAQTGMHAIENILGESGASIRYLHCGMFMENLLPQARSIMDAGVFSFPIAGQIPISLVAAHDVADVALQWLVREDWSGIESLAVPGPERFSFSQMAAILERILDRPVEYREAPVNQYIQSLVARGAGVEYAHDLVHMFGELARVINPAAEKMAQPGISTRFVAWVEKELMPLMSLPAVVAE